MTPRKNKRYTIKTSDGFSMGWSVSEIDEYPEDGGCEVTVRVTSLDKNCPVESIENRLGCIGNYECPEDHWFDTYRIITDWKYRSIYVVFKYQHDEDWGEDYDTRQHYGQGDYDTRFSF